MVTELTACRTTFFAFDALFIVIASAKSGNLKNKPGI
jgi:hypothetical protein